MRNLLLILFSVLSLGLWAQPAPPAVSIQSGPRLNRLSWAPVAGNAIRYQIFRGTTPANKVSLAIINSATTFRDNNLTPGVRYYYEVKALEGTLSSAASNEVSAVPNRVFYVAKSNPNNQDGTESNPLLSIASALNQCMANDTLILLPGTYTEPISASKAVSIGSRFLISKNPSDKHTAVVDGFQAVGSTYFWTFPFPGANQINRISGIRFTRLNFSGLSITGASVEDCRFDQLSNSQSNSVVLNLQAAVQFKNNQFSSVSLPNGYAIVSISQQKDSSSFDFSGNSFDNCISKSNFILFFSSGKKQELLFSRNQFRNCNLNTTLNYLGFQSGANKKVIVENNLLVKSGGLSIDADSIFVQNNTLYGFPLFGFRTGASLGKTPFAVVRNTIFQSSGLGTSTYVLGVNSGSIGTIQFENNTLGSTGQPAQAVYPGAKSGIQLLAGNLATYPQFADTLAGNFTLQSSSAAINSGKLVAGMATIDLNGNARVVSGLPDMGAYEFQGQNLSLNLELSSAARLVDLKWNGLNIPNISYKVIRTGSSGPQVLATGITLNRFADSTAVLYEPYEYQVEAMVNSTSVAFSNTQIGAANRVFYMSPAGSDNFPGSPLHPKLSFAAAGSRALANDTVLLLPGTYSDHFYLANQQLVIGSLFLTTNDKSYISNTILSGALFSDTLPLVYDATNATSSKLIAGFTIRDGRGEALKLVKANVQNMVIENNYTYPFTIGQFPRYAVYLRNALNFSNNQILNNLNPSIWATVFFEQNSPSHDLTIHSNTFKGNYAVSNVLGVTGPMTQSVYVEANRFESNNSAYSDPDLIWYYNAGVTTASKVYIRKNLLVNNPIYRAIHFQASEQDTLFIANNTIVHNKVGIRVNANSGKQTYIANNLILRNGINTTFSQIFIGGNVAPINQKVTFLNNIISDSSMTHVLAQVANIGRVDTSGSTQNYGAKVVFVDSLNGDFRLADASPGLGGGQLLSYLATTDFSGNSIPLPAGSNPDMGCFESFNITPVLISAVPEPDGIRLSWNAVSGTGINYGVERSLNGSSFVELQRGITATSYYDSSAVLNELCSYRVFVHTGAGSSQPSNTISALRRRIWYVSTTGVNTNSGSETSPLRTIANAISRALSGDTIVLEPGNYTERINFGPKDLVIGSRYLLTFNPAFIGSTVLDGFTVSNSGVLIFSSGGVRSFPCGIVGMTITRSKTSITEIADFILRRCIIENNGSSLFPQADALLNLGGNSRIDSCIIRNNTQNLPYTLVSMPGMTSESHFENNEVYNNAVVLTTISIGGKLRIVMNNKIYSNSGGWFYGTLAIGSVPGYPASRSYIGNNLIVKNSNFGLVTLGQNNGDSAFIFNNTISENTTSGLHLNSEYSCYTQLENNIFSNNGSYLSSNNITVSGTPVTLLHKARLYNNAISPSVSSPLSVIHGIEFLDILDSLGNVNFVPMYVDTTTSVLNYRLQNTSKLIGAGLNSMLTPAVDLAGATRPFPLQTTHDIGCYENQGAIPAPVLVEAESGNQQIRLYWERPSSPAIVRYRIYRSQSPFSNLGSATLLVEFDVKVPFHYLDTTQLQNNQTYYYSMTAGDEWGNWSLIGNQLLGIPRVPPTTPTNFVVSGGGRRIYAQWTAVLGTGIRYQLFRAMGNDSLSLYKDSILQTSFNDSQVVNYQNYRYAVRAVNSLNTRSGFTDTLQDFARRIFYVGVNGSNLQGGSEQYPMATFAFAVNAIQNEDTLLILPGTYHQRLPFADKAFLVAGKYLFTKDTADIFNTVINGSTLSNSVPLVFQTSNISGLRRIVGIRLTKSRGQLLALHNCKVLRIMADSNFTQPFSLGGGLIGFAGEAGFDSSWVFNNYQNAPASLVEFSTNQVTGPTTVRGNLFQNNRYGSVLVYHWTTYFSGLNFQVDGNRFVRNFGDAFNAMLLFFHNSNGASGQKFFVRNNLFASNIGCAIGTSPSDNDSVFVLGNTLVNNTMGGLFLETGRAGKVWIHNNIFNNYISGNLEIGTFGPPSPNMSFSLRNNLIGFREDSFPMKDALFLNNIGVVDTFNNWGAYALFQDSSTVANYRLKVNSPAIGLGTSLAMSGTTDITGAPRNQPVGQNQDAGCYESNGRFSAPVIVASEAGDQAMELFWKRSVSSGVTRYRIYRSTQPIPDEAMASYTYELLGQPDTYLDQQGLQNLTTYYYRLRAGNANGEWSEMSNQWIAIPRVPAPAPAQLVAKTGPRRIALSWTPVGLPNHYYQVFRDTLPNPKQLYKDSLLSSFVVDSGLVPYKTYYYKVRAVDQYNTKGYASSISGFANRIWFVDTAGSNSAFGLSDSAYKTFDFCYQVASAADTIVLNPGVYKEHFNVFLKRLVIASRYILDGNEQHIANTIIDGSNGLGTTTLITDMSNGHNLSSTEMHGLIGLTLRKSKGALIELSNAWLRRLIITDNVTQANTSSPLIYLGGIIVMDSCQIIDNQNFRPASLVNITGGYASNNYAILRNNTF
ncbi:MAG: DUF1565 domain-containing protein [Bacteroidetes bacterium]|nr:DUF1565 domain-containing protein [Bacteroidota bacterium]